MCPAHGCSGEVVALPSATLYFLIKEVKAPKAKKEEPIKKEEPVKAATADELTEDQKTELRTLCAEYTHKVSDGKERIKQFLKDKGLAKVTELKPADLSEFKAMVQI